MSKALKKIGVIAGAVALVATGVGAVAGAGLVVAGGVTVGQVAAIASVVATAANVGATVLQKPPPVKGSVTQLIIAPDAPQPYMMGEGYYGGVLRHDAAYGGEVNDVPNPYRGMVVVYSGGGPIQSITPYVDKAAVSAWYSGFLYTDTQLGDCPEASALTPNFAGLPGWDAASKLSGQAAILWNMKFDKKGKRFASGVPIIGAYGQWVKVYDPRLDSTFPGGSGAHRIDDEDTWAYSDNPALHAGVYAYGRYQNGKRTFGIGMEADAIDFGVIAAWANVCDTNNWTIFGVIYEPGDRWANLKDICAAGGALPVISSGGLLSFKYSAPQVSLDTLTVADVADGQVQVTMMQSWGDRINTIIPRYTSGDHEWNQVAADAVTVSAFVTEDGEEKKSEWPFNLVKDAGQAAQLAGYQLYDARETNPIVIPCLPRMRAYRPGECITLDLPDYGLEMDAIILKRELDPATMTVTLTLMEETTSKHAFALGQTPAPPAVPVDGQTGEERDDVSSSVNSNPPKTVASEAAQLALVVPEGTVVYRSDLGKTYFYNGGTSGTMADWTLFAATSFTAAEITFSPGGSLSSTDVQAALFELRDEKQPLDATLTALAAFNTNGILTQTAADTFVGRTITGTANEITVADGNGVAANPVLSLPAALTFSGKTITGGSITPEATPTTTAIGYLGSPLNTQNGTYTTVMSDAGKTIYHTSGSAHTWTIDSNANVAYPIGTMISFQNENGGGNVTIAITSDTLRWGSSTGSRTLAANGTATAQKMTSTSWRLTGDGIT